ncbi:membrane-associated guanylate kinase, WW and PDZ domain-containing protein 1 isoform X3 [Hydra vulgaris]|uniref:Membrane-associated guanylate kinase, WW and PDZ domain-containing protein 1 isoform X3 n=1 Tax=Hydra vulgaris TaxID=6087 RepID=A0ABM4C5I4_HYDVU
MNNSVRHWSSSVNKAVVQRSSNGSFNLCIEGGSEYGQFVVIGDVLTDKVLYKTGRLTPGEIILEINGTHIAGYTQSDGISLIRNSGNILRITSVISGFGISRDLRKYLGTRFSKGSIDHELQQTIRDNLYMRTVPCTTRSPRDGEVPGVDYEFLSVNAYLELERSGRLLESGFYEGNYYGTPKPPKTPMTPGTGTIRKQKVHKTEEKKDDLKDPLPINWEIAYTKDGEMYFVDHNSGRTQWEDPRKVKPPSRPSVLPPEESLPPGWEKVDDPKYGTYYIDHVNRKTQYEKPDFPQKNGKIDNSREVGRKNLIIDTSKLQGETFRVLLRKGAKGFGFTIIGGEQPGEVLQVNNIVRGGTADLDGHLRTGDIIMRLNGRNVLNWTHSDIIRFLQGTRVGETVEMDLVRGYELPFNSEGPEVQKLTSGISQLQNGNKSMLDGNQLNEKSMRYDNNSGYLSDGGGSRSGAATPVAFRSGPPQYIVVPVVRGPNGFGFTIADSPYGQRVKDLVDQRRCQGLQQGDVIIQINNSVVHNLDHSEVVEVLKSCPRGIPTNFQVQRSGLLSVVKSMPSAIGKMERPKSMPALDDDVSLAPGLRSTTSMGVISTNGQASTALSTYEERTHPQISESGDGYKSLKRAVQANARKTEPEVEIPSVYKDYVVTLKRGPGGFGFRIVGGQEEKTQVCIDTIVENGAAEQDGRLRPGDIILAVDGVNVVDASHKKVITLMGNAGLNGQVTLRLRRKNESSNNIEDYKKNPPRLQDLERARSDNESVHSDKVEEWLEDQHNPRNAYRNSQPMANIQAVSNRSKSEMNLSTKPALPIVTTKLQKEKIVNLSRTQNEGFGFVIMSSPSSNDSVIGRIIPGSPSDRCGELHVNDVLISVNDTDVSTLSHSEIVSMVKSSGLHVKLVVTPAYTQSNNPSDEVPPCPAKPQYYDDAPPRPAEPRNYTPSAIKNNDQLKNKEQERDYIQQIREKESQQPNRPKSAPLTSYNNEKDITDSKCVTASSKAFLPSDESDAEEKTAKTKTFSVVLKKGETGFGFSIKGGEGVPISILRLAENGAAWNDGRLKVGDEILEINNADSEVMSHSQAVNAIRNSGKSCELLIRRHIKSKESETVQPRIEYY